MKHSGNLGLCVKLACAKHFSTLEWSYWGLLRPQVVLNYAVPYALESCPNAWLPSPTSSMLLTLCLVHCHLPAIVRSLFFSVGTATLSVAPPWLFATVTYHYVTYYFQYLFIDGTTCLHNARSSGHPCWHRAYPEKNWHDRRNTYCRIKFLQKRTFLTFSFLGP